VFDDADNESASIVPPQQPRSRRGRADSRV